MDKLINFGNLPYIIAFLVVCAVIVFMYILVKNSKSTEKQNNIFMEQLRNISNATMTRQTRTEKKKTITSSWNTLWKDFFKYSGIMQYAELSTSGALGYAIVFVSYFIFFIIFRNLGIGIIPALGSVFLAKFFVDKKKEAERRKIDAQIPAFLSVLKSNIQANYTPELSLIDAISSTESPLYDELKIGKQMSETATFEAALQELRKTVKNENLLFLFNCIEISSAVGSNLENQIVIIEKIMEDNRDVGRKIVASVQEQMPTVYLSAVLLPGIFIYTYAVNESARNFWFTDLFSWVVFGVAVAIFAGGIWVMSKLIKGVGKF